jgi:glutamate dehydrogenase/leucine dehydrogenase
LPSTEDGDQLRTRNFLYSPDYIVNAVKVINVAKEHFRYGLDADLQEGIEHIPRTLQRYLETAGCEGVATHSVADRPARQRVEEAQSRRAKVSPESVYALTRGQETPRRQYGRTQ